MEVVKRNLISIVCGAVALLAMIVPFFPLGGSVSDLNSGLEQSDRALREAEDLYSRSHQLPIIDPKKREADELKLFPTRSVIDIGKQVVRDIETQSSGMVEKAMGRNVHQPIGGNMVFPNLRGGGRAANGFKQEYYRALDQIMRDMRATTPPTAEDEKNLADSIWLKEWKPKALNPQVEQDLLNQFNLTVVP